MTILGLLPVLALLRLWLPASTTGDPLPALRGEAALNHLKEHGLYGSLKEAVTAGRYCLYQESKQSDDWLADNHAQRLLARFTPDGLQVETGGDEGRSHRLRMKLRSAGYGSRQMAVSAGRLSAKGARIEYERAVGSGEWGAGITQEGGAKSAIRNPQSAIIEWYINTAAGLEQGFTLESAPGERRDGEWLRVALALEGELRVEAVEGGQALEFTDALGQRALRYDHLVVKDGGGRDLKARMAVSEEEGEVWLEVDDREAVWPVTIDPTFTQPQKLLASDAAAGDYFGISIAISGETVVIGAPADDGAEGSDQGSAYVFVHSGGVWSRQQKLIASDGAAFDRFGFSVAISGETLVVGALSDEGTAHIFMRNGGVWSRRQKLIASDAAAKDYFGISVAISGETVVVGASRDDNGAVDQGSAYVFVRSGGVWSQQQKLLASDGAAGEYFGHSVAISGETVVVSAQGQILSPLQGSAYVFVRSGGVWSQQQKLLASDGAAGDYFGVSVAISGETVVVGAPSDAGAAGRAQGSAYVFARSGTRWSQRQKLLATDASAGAQFGSSIAISGETVVVGAHLNAGAASRDQGSAYVFAHSGTRWNQRQKLLASDAAAEDMFGRSVALSGGTIVVGAPSDAGAAGANQGSAYAFVRSGRVWRQQQRPHAPRTIKRRATSQ